ncbi:MAG: hypothetical protein JRG92_11165 [Deltaproteobacteria bacterium]|nr:hypothetical protein [Deltaproteobacteria bacterium]MBW2384187.1 hypothetical protein [Deltaproteobacteria bacterium]MBW2696887.1 hypothetical protein [Deltaproteobacteria bacterium]
MTETDSARTLEHFRHRTPARIHVDGVAISGVDVRVREPGVDPDQAEDSDRAR